MFFDNDSEDVTEGTRDEVFHRDGQACWLCGDNTTTVNIAHQIHATAAKHPFLSFQENGTISLPNLSHSDNLIPLCPTCHTAYDLAYPEWIMVPDTDTLNHYIEHEENDYNHRKKDSHPRTLPSIDKTKIKYHPMILHPDFNLGRIRSSCKWPKQWLGEPTTVIHRVAWHGLLCSNPIRQLKGPSRRQFNSGVLPIYQILLGNLMRLWARPAPGRHGIF